jgi:hypothetical protein
VASKGKHRHKPSPVQAEKRARSVDCSDVPHFHLCCMNLTPPPLRCWEKPAPFPLSCLPCDGPLWCGHGCGKLFVLSLTSAINYFRSPLPPMPPAPRQPLKRHHVPGLYATSPPLRPQMLAIVQGQTETMRPLNHSPRPMPWHWQLAPQMVPRMRAWT